MSHSASNTTGLIPGLRRNLFRPLERLLSAVEYAFLALCSGAVILAMVLTTVDVVLRYGFRSPLGWSFDLIMLYLLPAAYYLAFSYGMKVRVHLAVDFFAGILPGAVLRAVNPLILLIGALFCGYIAWLIGSEAWASMRRGDVLFGSVPWPTWPTGAIIGLSFLAFALRLVLVSFQTAFPEE